MNSFLGFCLAIIGLILLLKYDDTIGFWGTMICASIFLAAAFGVR